MTEILDTDADDDNAYDNNGNCSNTGLYDAGGHIITSRWIDYCDEVMDREKERRRLGD